jgi:hypothetical protein
MKTILVAAAIGLTLTFGANAADNSQQTKMATCNKEAGDKG